MYVLITVSIEILIFTELFYELKDSTLYNSTISKMELELSRVDYTIVGLTYPNCLKLLPSPGPKYQQKVTMSYTKCFVRNTNYNFRLQ